MKESMIISIIFTINLVLRNSPTNAQQDAQPQGSCNSCCQGPIGPQGTPGIPGVPGSNGLQGYVGPKGESLKGDKGDSLKGDDGQHGEKGDNGNPGLKGERGFSGPPGKSGPMGLAGPSGSSGAPGVKGQKGEMGQSQLSAFSAVRSTSFTPSSSGQAIPFEQIHTNIGDDFDAASGRFTCEVPGLYSFSYGIGFYSASQVVCLMQNLEKINCVIEGSPTSQRVVMSNTAVLQLSAEDQIWLWCQVSGRIIFSTGFSYTSFSGVMLYEI